MLSISLALAVLAAAAQGGTVSGRPSVPKTTAVLAGHVVDEDGAAVASAWVSASRWKTIAGKRRFTESRSVQVDADGYFLIAGLTPGSYTLSASPEDDPRATGGVESYQPIDSAEPIPLSAGSEVRDIRLVLRKARVFGVSGTAVNEATGERIRDARLVLAPVASEGAGGHSARIREGVFRFTNVLPGAYLIQTNPSDLTRDEETRGYREVGLFGRMRVVVGESDVHDVTVQLGPGGKLAGSFKMTTAGAALPEVGLTLGPLEGLGPILGVRVSADGTFRLSNVPPDRYRVYITLPPANYVASIRAHGQEVKDTLDLTSGGVPTMEILLSPNGAEISGRVRNADRETTVVLWGPSGTGPRMTQTSGQGSFTIQCLSPGNYHILALEDAFLIPPDDMETWRALQAQATAVTVREGARVWIALVPLLQ